MISPSIRETVLVMAVTRAEVHAGPLVECPISPRGKANKDGHSVHKHDGRCGTVATGVTVRFRSLYRVSDRAPVHWEDMKTTGEDDVHKEAIAIHCQCTQTTP